VVTLSTSAVSVSATFALIPPPSRSLNVSRGTCTASFPEGTTVTLIPTTQSGSVFQGWNGACSGTSSCVLTLSSSASVRAKMKKIKPTASPPPTGSSSVTQEEPTGSSSVTKEEIKRQKKLAKAEKKKQKKLAKAEKKKQKKLAKAEKLLAKIQKVLAKIEQKLLTHADNPKAVNKLNKKKVKLLANRDKIQEKYSIN
jgi:hypothetical protein